MLPYELDGDDRAVRIELAGREVSPVEVSAEILQGAEDARREPRSAGRSKAP